jgi:hypothetical protein
MMLTYDKIRVEIEEGIVYLSMYAVNRKPLAPSEAALFAGCVRWLDAVEVKRAVKLARTCETPGELWTALQPKPPKPKRPPKKGDFRCIRYNSMTGYYYREYW